jgi:hypothetical protein
LFDDLNALQSRRSKNPGEIGIFAAKIKINTGL